MRVLTPEEHVRLKDSGLLPPKNFNEGFDYSAMKPSVECLHPETNEQIMYYPMDYKRNLAIVKLAEEQEAAKKKHEQSLRRIGGEQPS